MKVAAIMPCRGRAEQTVTNVRRLLATAGDVDWRLICMVDRDKAVFDALLAARTGAQVRMQTAEDMRGYWWALRNATHSEEAPFLVNLANDLLPGQHWLQRAVWAYGMSFGDGPGMIGFNDGHHEVGHSCHFLISRDLLDRYGGWPVWYDHNYGDTELCQRAIADDLYAKAPWATLFHDHPYFGGQDDQIYAEGRAKVTHDQRLYEYRRATGWPTTSR